MCSAVCCSSGAQVYSTAYMLQRLQCKRAWGSTAKMASRWRQFTSAREELNTVYAASVRFSPYQRDAIIEGASDYRRVYTDRRSEGLNHVWKIHKMQCSRELLFDRRLEWMNELEVYTCGKSAVCFRLRAAERSISWICRGKCTAHLVVPISV